MKKCPYCAEEIQDAAIKCKHCGSDLTEKQIRITEAEKPIRTIDARKGNSIVLKLVGIIFMVGGLFAWLVNLWLGITIFIVGLFLAIAGRAQD